MGNDGSLVSLQCLQSNMRNLTLRLAHKHLTGGGQHLLVLTLDLNLQQQDETMMEQIAYFTVTNYSLITIWFYVTICSLVRRQIPFTFAGFSLKKEINQHSILTFKVEDI